MSGASIRFISSVPGLSTPPGYSYVASSSGELVLFAGQVALDAQGNLVGSGDFDAQVRQTFANLGRVLAAAECAAADVLRVSYYVVGLTRERVLAIRAQRDVFFADPKPAATLLGVAALFHPDALIEIEVIAARRH
jgi:enamine deaminase RidA (YjgF/YER057c/UK114 family)